MYSLKHDSMVCLEGAEWQSLLEGLKLGAETAHSGSWFHMWMVLGKKEYRCEFTVD